MFKMLLVWLGLTGAIMLSINTIRHMEGAEVISTFRMFAYSALCSFLAIVLLIGIVIVF